MIRIVPPRRRPRYALGAVSPSSCDPQMQYFDSERTQTCRSFSDVDPPPKIDTAGLGPQCLAMVAAKLAAAKAAGKSTSGIVPSSYAGMTEPQCIKALVKMGIVPKSTPKSGAPNWLLPVAIGGGIIAVALWMRSRK